MVIGYHITPQCIANSKGQVQAESPWLDFLVDDSPGEQKVFYDLDASVAALMRKLELDEGDGRRLLGRKKLSSAPWRISAPRRDRSPSLRVFGRCWPPASMN